jgi:hypothetical protein
VSLIDCITCEGRGSRYNVPSIKEKKVKEKLYLCGRVLLVLEDYEFKVFTFVTLYKLKVSYLVPEVC